MNSRKGMRSRPLTIFLSFLLTAGSSCSAGADESSEKISPKLLHREACPPYCITPMQFHPDIRFLGELEVKSIIEAREAVLVDVRDRAEARTTGSIEGATLLPFYDIGLEYGADPLRHARAVKWLRSQPKLIIFDDGLHDYRAIRVLLELLKEGISGEKLYWYRGGMLHWHQAGLPMGKVADFHSLGNSQ